MRRRPFGDIRRALCEKMAIEVTQGYAQSAMTCTDMDGQGDYVDPISTFPLRRGF